MKTSFITVIFSILYNFLFKLRANIIRLVHFTLLLYRADGHYVGMQGLGFSQQ
jgi:hypothetical protein